MADKVVAARAPTGTHDVLWPESTRWEALLALFAGQAERAGYGLAHTPIFEDVKVFRRGTGEGSDVVGKEMYEFEDRGGRALALRPEGTAPLVRAWVQHRPPLPWKAWYATPAFRYERPQAGRYRQHHQVGVEALGTADADLDVEVIALAHGFFREIGLTRVRLLVNSMGHTACRASYVELLSEYLAEHQDELVDEHREGWRLNPLRVLDCKNESCVAVTAKGPMLVDHLCAECRDHFDQVLAGLSALGIESTLAPRLVRGFDYYSRTTFEFVADALDAAQNAVGGGGRYDTLAEQLGGKPTSGIGFGSGVERVLLARAAEGIVTPLLKRSLDVFVVDTTGDVGVARLVEDLRSAGVATERAYDQRSMKAQMKVADKSGARWALLIGPEELAAGEVTMKDLRSEDFNQAQSRVARSEIVSTVQELLTK